MFGHVGLGLGVGLLVGGGVALLLLVGRKWGLRPGGIFASGLQRIVGAFAGTGALIQKTYAPFFEQCQLNPDQQARLKDLVLKRTMAGVRAGIAGAGKKTDAAQRMALMEQVKTETAVQNAQIQQLLGEASYQAFQEFEKTIPDRMLISQFASKFSRTPLAPSTGQQEELCQQMIASRARFEWTTPISQRNQPGIEYLSGLNQEILSAFAQEEETFGRQFLAEAGRVLNPEQIIAFGQFLERQRQSQVNQMKMAAKLFAVGKS
jgi:hypothetical protein